MKGFIKGTEITVEVMQLTDKKEREILDSQDLSYADKIFVKIKDDGNRKGGSYVFRVWDGRLTVNSL